MTRYSFSVAAFALGVSAVAAEVPVNVPNNISALLENYCFDCHEDGTEKGDVRLDNLKDLSLDAKLDMMNRVHEKLYFEEMPPKKKDQPTEEERKKLVDWLSETLLANNASKLEDKLRHPEYGNKVDHDKLFSGKYKDLPAYTSDRRWLISEFIFDAKFNKLLYYSPSRDIDKKRVPVIGDNNRKSVNLTNPFLLPAHSGVRYYDTTTLDGGHLLTMITNAREVAQYLVEQEKKGKTFPTISTIMAQEWKDQATLSAIEIYLKDNIDGLTAEIYKDKNEAMLPVFVATKIEAPPQLLDAKGNPIKRAVYDTAKPSNEEQLEIWRAVSKHSEAGISDAELITRCQKEWFLVGVNDRTITLRVTLMSGYMEDIRSRMDKAMKQSPKRPSTWKPTEADTAMVQQLILKHREKGDTYNVIVSKCMQEWTQTLREARSKSSPVSDELLGDLVDQLYQNIFERKPTDAERNEHKTIVRTNMEKLGYQSAIEKLIQTLILNTEFVYRYEFGQGNPDEHGRKTLSPRDASYAIAYALTDSSPDKQLVEAVNSGKLATREDYKREVTRMLKSRNQYYIIDEAAERIGSPDSFTNMPIRELRFFREFFGYPNMLPIFKDNKRFGGDYINTTGRLVSEADMLVAYILEKDQNVFEELLTTENFYVYHSGDNEAMRVSTERIKRIYDHFKDTNWKDFTEEDMKTHKAFFDEIGMRGVDSSKIGNDTGRQDTVRTFKQSMTSYAERLGKGQTAAVPFDAYPAHGMSEATTRAGMKMGIADVAKCFNLDIANWNYQSEQPAKMEHRKGILTHPAWLIAHAANTATDPIRRGKWVREKLLAGTVPDVPVTVDAVIPEDIHNTLRSRLEKVTKAEYCWGCHERMNPLGLSFEMYDDFGRFRSEESLEAPENLIKKMPDKGAPELDLRDIYKTLPVLTTGNLAGTGDPNLDGDVKNAIDLTERLAKSTKVRQSIIRHAFRYFMGRNETLSDSKTLIEADQAYVQSGGSFDAVIVSLLTSDSFIYRKAN